MPVAVFHNFVSSVMARPYIGLAIIFLMSLLVRLPNLDRPLSKHHEANAALVLINAEVWNEKGPAASNYLPVNAYHFAGDNFNDSTNLAKGFVINNSFGALWYILPYYFFKLLQVQPSPLLLQVYNLLLHAITLWLVYGIAIMLFSKTEKGKQLALCLALFYAFAPGPLWFHGNGYSHEIAVLPFVFGAVLLYLQMLRDAKINGGRLLLLFLLVVGGILCDWLMCFVAFAIFVAEIISFRKREQPFLLPPVFTAAVAAGVGIVVWHFSSFMGFDNYLQALTSRYLHRGVTGESERGGIAANVGILSFYLLAYGMLLPAAFASLISKRCRTSINNLPLLKGFLIAATLVVAGHHIIFKGFTVVHDYSVTKAAIIIVILAAVFILLMRRYWIRIALVVLLLASNLIIYYAVNRPGQVAANGQPYNYFEKLGKEMKAVAEPDEYVFTNAPEFSYNLVYYSKRYYRLVPNEQEARQLFEKLPGNSAIYIHTNGFDYDRFVRLRK